MLRCQRLLSSSAFRLLRPLSSSSSPSPPSLPPKTADFVIVGGGIAGCSLLYHLTELGFSNVVLLERDLPTSGSTWHAAGMVWSLRTSEIESQLLEYSWDMMKSMEAREGLSAGCQEHGGLFLAHDEARLNENRRLSEISALAGVESRIITPQEAKELFPLMDVSRLHGALHFEKGGGVDQSGLCEALLRGSVRRGGRVLTHTDVTGIDTKTTATGHRKVTGVTTTRGCIETEHVIACGGAWTGHVGRLAGVSVPLQPFKHAYIVTEPIPGAQGLPNIRHNDLLFYVRPQGERLMIGGYESNPVFCDAEPNFAFSLYDLDFDHFEQHLERASSLIPALNHTGIKTTVCGPESFTPDHKPLMGEAPDLRGFFVLCGFNSAGIMLSLGFGRELAARLTKARSQLDMYSYDIRRFNKVQMDSEAWVTERSHEAFVKNYAIRYDRDEPLAGRNIIKDALYDELLAKGCVYQERQGMERPAWFQPPDKRQTAPPLPYDFSGTYGREPHIDYPYRDLLELECTYDLPLHLESVIKRESAAVRERVAVFNQTSFGKLYLLGPDAKEAANWIFSADVDRDVGATVYTLTLNRHAGIEGDLTVSVIAPGDGQPHTPSFEEETGFYLTVGAAVRQYLLSYFNGIIGDRGYDCRVQDCTEDIALLSVQGPLSRQVLAQLTDADLSNEAFPFSSHRVIPVAGHSCRALRLSFVGELGWELHLPSSSAVPVYRALMTAGEKLGISDAGFRVLDALSLEKGYRHWHADIRTDDNPLQANMAFACKLQTPKPFSGRAALEALKAEGPPAKKLVFFELLDRSVMLNGLEPILRDGQFVGHLRRGDFAPTLDRPIGCGYVDAPGPGMKVDTKFLSEGRWEVQRLGKRYVAKPHLKPLFDPLNRRLKGIYDIPE